MIYIYIIYPLLQPTSSTTSLPCFSLANPREAAVTAVTSAQVESRLSQQVVRLVTLVEIPQKPWENPGKTMGKWWLNGGLMVVEWWLNGGYNGIYPLVMTNIGKL